MIEQEDHSPCSILQMITLFIFLRDTIPSVQVYIPVMINHFAPNVPIKLSFILVYYIFSDFLFFETIYSLLNITDLWINYSIVT